MVEIYALIYRQQGTSEEFVSRLPRLMTWLRALHASGALVACGGGGFADDTGGGLTLIRAATPEEAEGIAAANPMNEIGRTELMLWDCFYADLQHLENLGKLETVPSE